MKHKLVSYSVPNKPRLKGERYTTIDLLPSITTAKSSSSKKITLFVCSMMALEEKMKMITTIYQQNIN